MWRLLKGECFLPNNSIAELKRLYAIETKAKSKLRLLCVVQRKRGFSIDDISGNLDIPRRTIHGWLTRFQNRGVEAKDSIKQNGRPTELTKRQIKSLVRDLERGPPHNKNGLWTTKEVSELLKKKYRISFVHQHVWRVLNNLKFSLQRPRKRHYKSASIEEKERFKKKQNEKQDITEKKVLLWAYKMRQRSV